jgi:hypothetical protein
MSQKQSSSTTLSSDKMASVFGKGVVTLRVVNTKMDTPIPPKLLFTVTELRQHLENRPVVTWLVKEHENVTNFTTERYNLINKIMGWNNDAGSGRQSHSDDTLSVLYESSIYDEQCASDTGGSCVSTSSRSVWSAEAKTGTSRPRQFKRYSLKRTWPQPADLLYKEAKLAVLEVVEFNLTRIYINDQKQLQAQYERELAEIRSRYN